MCGWGVGGGAPSIHGGPSPSHLRRMNTCSWNCFAQQYDHTSPSWLKQNTQHGQNQNCISEFLCLGSSTMSRVRFMNAVTDEELHLPHHILTRVRTDMPATTLELYLKYIASLRERPMSAIRLVTTTVDGDSCVISCSGSSSRCWPVYNKKLMAKFWCKWW